MLCCGVLFAVCLRQGEGKTGERRDRESERRKGEAEREVDRDMRRGR